MHVNRAGIVLLNEVFIEFKLKIIAKKTTT